MKPKQIRLTHRVGIPIVISLVLLSALIVSTLAQAAPLAQGPIIDDVTYGMSLIPQDVKLCVGQTEVFEVSIPLVVTEHIGNQAPYTYNVYYGNEEVTATVVNENVGTIDSRRMRTSFAVPSGGFDPDDELATLVRPIQRRLDRRGSVNTPLRLGYLFTAKEKGVTTVRFEHTRSAKPLTRALTLTAQVEVRDCWEAYATGLWTGNTANNWTKKDICSLERPFVLDGNGKAVAGGGFADFGSRAFFFWPFRDPFAVAGLTALQDGRYIMVGGADITAFDKTVHCTLVGGGSYQQFLFENRTPREGNFILNGSSTNYCEGVAIYTAQEVIEVAFRALGSGQACQESLPGLNP